MKRKRIWLGVGMVLLTFCQGLGALSPEGKLDSLNNLLSATTDDSLKAELLSMMFGAVVDSDLEKARSFLEQADEVVTGQKCLCCYLIHRRNWGNYYESKGDHQKAEKEFLGLIEKYENSACWKKRAIGIYFNLGLVYQSMGDLEKALRYLSLYDELAMETGNNDYQLAALNNLGIIYFQLKQYDQAEEYYGKALSVALEKGATNHAASIHLNLGNIQYTRSNYQSALQSFLEALAIGEEQGDSARLPSRYINVGTAYYALGKHEPAMDYLQRGLKSAQRIGNRGLEANAVRNMASVSSAKGDYNGAIRYMREALLYYEEIGASPSLLRAYPDLAGYYSKTGDFKKAYETQIIYSKLSDSISKSYLDSKLADQLAAFEANRLKAENDSIQSALTISEQVGEIKDLKLSRYGFLVSGLAGIVILVVVVALLVMRSFRLRESLRSAELKHTILRARMNPHFLFNAMNSIQNAILNRDKMLAYEYHAKFSDLMRMILMHSEQKTIKLSEEITALRLYLELEQFRTSQGFDFEINCARDIDLDAQEIPSMLLQPFVENAIWHGVLNRETPGKIQIEIARDSQCLRCTVEDNGVGREAAMQIRNMSKPDHQSVATSLTRDRITLFQKQYGKGIGLEIIDKKNGTEATGTLVKISIQLSNTL